MGRLKSFFCDYPENEGVSAFQGNHTATAGVDTQSCPDKFSFTGGCRQLLQNLRICVATAMSCLPQPVHTADSNNASLMLLVPFNEMTVLNELGSGDPVCCQPEDALLVPAAMIHQIHIANAVPIAIIDIPAALTAPGVTNPDECLIRKISSTSMPALHLLTGYTKMLMQVGDNLSPDLTVLVSTQIQDLVTLLLGPKQEEAQVTSKCSLRAARFEAIKHDILEHSAESELSISQVARRQGISPQYIRTLFHCEETTFADYVTDLRLEHAYQHLCNPAYSDCCISTLAFDMGFNNLSWFNRAFKQRFNLTPSEVRNLSKRSANQ